MKNAVKNCCIFRIYKLKFTEIHHNYFFFS